MTGILCALPMIGAPTSATSGGSGGGGGAFTVSLNRSSVSGSSTASSITTNSVTATGSGGTSPYTYAWSRVSGDRSISATSSASRTTSFTRTGCTAGTSYSGTWRCRVTDSAGTTVYSSNVSITITCTGSSGGGSSGGGTFNGVNDTTITAIGLAVQKIAEFSINSNGTYTDGNTGGTWNSSSTVGSGYEVKAVVTSGSLETGTTGTWLSLSSNRSWTVADGVQDDVAESATFTLSIRAAGSTTVLDTATITLRANALGGV